MTAFGDILSNLRDGLPKVLGMGMLTLVLVGDLLFAMLQVYPTVRLHSGLASQLAEARQALIAPAGDAQVEAALKAKLAKMEAKLDTQAGAFLAESDVSVVLNHLYSYAEENGVQIAKVQAASAAGPTTSKDTSHDVQSFQVEVSGSTVQLIHFVGRLQEASLSAVVINQLVIKSGKGSQGTRTLSMNLLLYTSPYATAKASTPRQP